MKTKISLLGATLIAVGVSLILSNTSAAQMYGKSQPSHAAPAGTPAANPTATPGEAKPGTVLSGGVIVATPISKEEAAKKYPPPKGKNYPDADANYAFSHKPGYFASPYAPGKIFDCSAIPHGSLVLDTYANHVFVRP